MSEAKGNVNLSADQLEGILARLLEAARKPVVTEREQRELEAAQQTRLEGAASEKERQEKMRAGIKFCDHMKAYPWNGQTCAVFVKGCGDQGSGNFFICQHCQGRIHGDDPLPGAVYDSIRDIWDKNEFNRLWRLSQQSGMIG